MNSEDISRLFNQIFTVPLEVQNDRIKPNGDIYWWGEFYWVQKKEDVYLVMTHYNGGEFDHSAFDTEEEAIKFAKLRENDEQIKLQKGL